MASLSPLFPMYPTGPLSTGPFHVSLSLPGPQSIISKGIGVTANCGLLIPNIDYLIQFADGNMGIADNLKRSMKAKNINKCKTEDSFKQFAKLVKIDIPDPSKYKTKNGYSIPLNLITIDPSEDLMGIRAMEKTIIKSIFETQKPYIEIAKFVIENIAKIEDIIARFMPILAPAPSIDVRLAIQSEKPKTNAGQQNIRPKALGYGGGTDIKSQLGKLDSLRKSRKEVKISREGKVTTTPARKDPVGTQSGTPEATTSDTLGKEYKVISTVYSTGEFDPSVHYKYIYKDIPDDSLGDLDDSSDLTIGDDDPYAKLKPQRVIFGIFNSKGELLNPFTKLKALDGFGNEVDTPHTAADWITRSPKWYFPNNIGNQSAQYSWPRFGSPFYYWERWGEVIRSQNAPDPGQGNPSYTRKKYEDGLRKGEYIVDFSGTNEKQDFINYFTDLVSKKINASDGLDPQERVDSINSVISQLSVKDSEGTQQVGPYTVEKTNIDNHLDNAFKYGILNSATFVNPNNNQPMSIPDGLKYPLKPSTVRVSGKDIWMDPESDYDIKVIKVDSVLDIRYEDSQGSPEIDTQILSFIKNTLSISVDNNGTKLPFSISIAKNQSAPSTYENITEYQLDNWNYDDPDGLLGQEKPKLNNNNTYTIQVWRYQENPYYSTAASFKSLLQSNLYSELEKISDANWSYKEFKIDQTTSTSAAVSGTQPVDYDIQGYVSGGPTVQKVKVQKLANQNDNFITQWYYKIGNGQLKWYSSPPTTWNTNNFTLDWSTESSPSYTANGSFPPTKVVDTKTFHIEKVSGTSSWKFSDIKLAKETRTYTQVANGNKTLADGSVIEVLNYKIKRWIVWDATVDVGTNINGKTVLPGFQQNNNMSLLYPTFGNNSTLSISSVVTPIPAFQVRVKDTTKYGKMIDPSKITNNHLTNPELYSSGKYGGSPQEVGLLKRYMRTELDTETYYIVEGVLVDSNMQNGPSGGNQNNNNPNNQSGGGTEWYRMPSAIGAVKVFLSMLADIFSKLIPAINKLISLFKNPASFITDIISEKLGESFLIFSPEAMDVMKKLPTLAPNLREEFVKNSVLNNYIYVNPDGSYKFLLDGSGLMKLAILGNTITFGMQLSMLKPIIKLIFGIDFADIPNMSLDSFLNKDINANKSPVDNIGNIDIRPTQNTVTNTVVTQSNGKENTEEVSIVYSTGKFVEGVDYRYIYITDYVAKLIKEADELELTNDPDNLEQAKAKLELALHSDPKNDFIKSKLDDLVKKTNSYIQPILKFLIEIVSLPIKIIAGIIQWLLDFFKSLAALPTLPSKMAEFLSFKWIMDFVSPQGILALAGIKFDIPKLLDWVSNLKNYPKDYEFDLSEVIDIALLTKQPKVKKEQFFDMLKKPFRILFSILCLLEALINAIIDFIWAAMGIEAIIPPPHINLCRQLNEDPSPQEIMDILNGLMKDPGPAKSSDVGNNTDPTKDASNQTGYDFIYDIKLSDGRSLRDLNQEELKQFIEDNKDISFDFLFD